MKGLFRDPAVPAVFLVACLLLILAWTASYLHSSDGPCDVSSLPGATTTCEVQGRLLPPSQHWVVTENGRTVASGTLPEPGDYLPMLAVFAFPFVVWGGGKLVRRALRRAGELPH